MADAEANLAACWAAGDDVGASQWEAWVDAHDPAREAPSATLGGAALWYAERGLRVFPLQAGTKVPFPRSRGCKDATSDPQQVASWWAAVPYANIGIATGHVVDVIDIDGLQGNVSLAGLRHQHEGFPQPRLGHVSTPRAGGRHYYVPVHPQGRGNGAALAPGIDYRGRGGYVVAPPSRTAQGTYRWLTPLALP